ncbi:MAG: hypothetical protein JSV90_07720 [Methanobacteriota archaeon]|nr:MAG: hypothetical protein JSV90_07720 [Euryarchaeota archaeon]
MAIAAASMLVAGLMLATIVVAPASQVDAELESAPSDNPTIVTGTVYDSGGTPVIGADVNVSMYDGATLRSYQTDVTDSLGMYEASFGFGIGGDEWGVNDTILVVAEYGEEIGTNSTVAHAIDDPGMLQYVNVTIGTVIPEFGDLGAILPIVGSLGIFMALFFARRKNSD